MTMPSGYAPIQYAGNGVTVTFTIPWYFLSATDVAVIKRSVAGTDSTLSPTLYSVSGAGNTNGGSVTLVTAPLTGEKVTIAADPIIQQQTHYLLQGLFPSTDTEAAVDLLTRISQVLRIRSDRSIRAPDGDVGPTMLLPTSAVRGAGTGTYLTFAAGSGDAQLATTLPSGTLSTSSVGLVVSPQSQAEAAASVTPANFEKYFGYVIRQASNTVPGTTDLTIGITNSNSQAKQATGSVSYFPRDTYLYKPSATLFVGGTNTTNGGGIRGEDVAATLVSIDTATLGAGNYFQLPGSQALENIQFRTVGLVKTGTIIKLSNDVPSLFTGNQRLSRTWVFGGNRAYEVGNTTITTFDHTRAEAAAVGEYCNPDSSSGGGYATTLLHLNSLYHGNTQNINYSCTLNSMGIAFVGGSIEDSTGASPQAFFQNVNTLSFCATYSEGNAGQPWLSCSSVGNVAVTGHTNNGGGSLTISDTSTFAAIRSCAGSGASNLIAAGGTTNKLLIESSQFPNLGSTITGERVVILNSDINGLKHAITAKGSAAQGIQSVAANGPFMSKSQRVNITAAPATDAFRFLDDIASTSSVPVPLNGYLCGEFSIIAIDNSNGANFAMYRFQVYSAANGAGSAAIVLIGANQRIGTGGTDPGTSANPFSVAADGGGGAIKLQFTKNAAVANVRLDIVYVGASI